MHSARIRAKKYIIPCAIFLLAFSLRLQGNTFGLPYFFHPDETKLTTLAWKMAEEGRLNPEKFFYPTGFIYLLIFSFKIFSLLGLSFHSYPADFIMLYWLGRFCSALLGAGTVVLVYSLGRRVFGFFPGIVAAIILCLNPIHLKYSHYATTDIASLFFILLSLSLITMSLRGSRFLTTDSKQARQSDKVVTRTKPLAAFLPGFFGGVAIGIKYNAWPIIFPLLFSPLSILFCLFGFLLTTPFAIIDSRHFLLDFIEILIIPRSYWLGLTHSSPFYYFYDFRPIAGVGVIFIFSILGLFSRLKNWTRPETLLMSFFLPYIILASFSVEKIDRFFLPAMIIFILWAGVGINNTAMVLGRLKGRPYLMLFILVVLLSISPLFNAIKYIQILDGKDNRIIASEWIRENIPPHSHLALFDHLWTTPPLEGAEYKFSSIPLIYKNKDLDREKFKLRLSKNRIIASIIGKVTGKKVSPEMFQPRIDRLIPLEDFMLFPLRYFQKKGVEYIIISGFFKDDLLSQDTARYFPKLSSSSRTFFNELDRKSKLIYSLPPVKGFEKDYAVGPSIEIYKLDN